MRKLRVIELYAGIGRCADPFRNWRRAQIALLADWNAHAQDTYRLNHPNAPYILKDLSQASVHDLEVAAGGKIDVVLGCPPCQGFSESGRRDSADRRNNHVIKFVRLAVGARPLAIAMENVPMAALSQQFEDATALLENAGYVWTAGILNAALYGSAQTRHRLVLVALRRSLWVEPILPAATHFFEGQYFDYKSQSLLEPLKASDHLLGLTSSARRAADLLKGNFSLPRVRKRIPTFSDVSTGLPVIGSRSARALGHIPWAHSAATLKKMASVAEGGRLKTKAEYYGAAYARLHRHGLARTLTTYFPNAGSGRYWHPIDNRAITVREAARLQGVPDSFEFSGGATMANATLLGNALDAHLAVATYKAVRRALE